ncbi:hypothetical protein TNCV_328011 [Trichonephila clavipes]|nr:hypothetical protein TNCV_328011 [Trichonephila clavipes]
MSRVRVQVPLKYCRVEESMHGNLSRLNVVGVVSTGSGANSGVIPVTRLRFKIMRSVANSPLEALQCDVNTTLTDSLSF